MTLYSRSMLAKSENSEKMLQGEIDDLEKAISRHRYRVEESLRLRLRSNEERSADAEAQYQLQLHLSRIFYEAFSVSK